jgi:superoxide dismutase, Cu-Zn family
MKKLTLLTGTMLFFLLSACGPQEHDEMADRDMGYDEPSVELAVVVIHPTEGNDAEGVVTFTHEDDGVRVHAEISGLDAGGTHGFHIHEYGDCRASDAESAGGHFNPTDQDHGGPMDDERHIGDMGNLEANEDGVAEYEYLDDKIELGGANSVIGYAVVVHEQRDDLESQPVGDAGGRIGCGVIGVGNADH